MVWPPSTLLVFADYRGAQTAGLVTTGAFQQPFTLAGGQTTGPPLGSAAASRCALVPWPFGQSAYDQARGQVALPSWNGSLRRQARDATGFEFRRHRVYDPKTGRFTQEDPIGLAGGLNLYGYAGGDPVNFSDPFGLFACPPYCDVFQQLAAWAPAMNGAMAVFAAGSVVGGVATTAGALGEGVSTATGIASSAALGRAGEAAAGIVKNTARIASATGTAAYRVPDALNSTTLTEVKSVARSNLTNQIRDFAAFANSTGRTFELVVRQTTEFSRPLADFIKNNGIQIRFLP